MGPILFNALRVFIEVNTKHYLEHTKERVVHKIQSNL